MKPENQPLKINWIQSFTTIPERAGFYAKCEIGNYETGKTVLVILGAPVEAGYSEYLKGDLSGELRKRAEDALYVFLSTEPFPEGITYFEWMADNTFHQTSSVPSWAELILQ